MKHYIPNSCREPVRRYGISLGEEAASVVLCGILLAFLLAHVALKFAGG